MHENRFIRLLIVFGIAVAGTLLFVLLPQAFGVKNTDLLLPGFLFGALSALVIEILWSVLDFSIFNNLVFTIVRWAIVAIAAFFAIGATIGTLEPIRQTIVEAEGMNFLAYTFLFMSSACPGAMIGTCLAFTRKTYDDREDYSWAILAGYGVSLIIGIIFALLGLIGTGFASIASYFTLIIGALLIPASVVLFGYPLGCVGDFDGFFPLWMDNLKSNKKKSSSYKSSSSNKSTYSSSKPTSTPSYEEDEVEEDTRKFSLTGLKTEMYSIAHKYDGRIITLSHDSKLYLSVTNTISGHNINFKVKGKLKAGYVTNEYEARDVNENLTSELQSLVNDLVNEAYDEIDAMREKYSNFDEEYEVDAQVGEITPY